MAQICKNIRECFTRGYQAITDLESKENKSYDKIEEDIEKMNNWATLETETRSIIEDTVKYFSKFRENEPKESELNSIKKQASQLKVEYQKLYNRHTELVALVKAGPNVVKRQYNYSKTRKDKIVKHARNALIAAILLGMILGGVIAWRDYHGKTIPIVFGVLIGGGSVTVIGGLAYLILISVARRGVKKWEGLQDRFSVAMLKVLDKPIDKKAEVLYPVANTLLNKIIDEPTIVTRGSKALIKQCDKYDETST